MLYFIAVSSSWVFWINISLSRHFSFAFRINWLSSEIREQRLLLEKLHQAIISKNDISTRLTDDWFTQQCQLWICRVLSHNQRRKIGWCFFFFFCLRVLVLFTSSTDKLLWVVRDVFLPLPNSSRQSRDSDLCRQCRRFPFSIKFFLRGFGWRSLRLRLILKHPAALEENLSPREQIAGGQVSWVDSESVTTNLLNANKIYALTLTVEHCFKEPSWYACSHTPLTLRIKNRDAMDIFHKKSPLHKCTSAVLQLWITVLAPNRTKRFWMTVWRIALSMTFDFLEIELL